MELMGLRNIKWSSKLGLRGGNVVILLAFLLLFFGFGRLQGASLLNINFGQDESPTKVGVAAAGQTPGDFWNFYTRNDGMGGWRTLGSLTNLKLADGTTSSVGMTVANAPGSWGNGSSDEMYGNYLYPFSGVATITITNLAAGEHELYVYAHDGNYHLTVGATDYGSKSCRDDEPNGVPVWHEGRQYVRFTGVNVGTGEVVTLTVLPGLDGYAVISGLQLVSAPPPPPPVAFLANVDFGAGAGPTAKTGVAAIGQAGDFWNFYTRDDGVGGWRTWGSLSNLALANGTASGVGMNVVNAPGAWGTSSTDAMYSDYLYPFSGNATITLTNLPGGQYDFYVYAHDGSYELNVGGTVIGSKTCRDTDLNGAPVWEEGRHYVRFAGVGVQAGDDLVLTVHPGVDGYAIIAGLQIATSAEVPTNTPPQIVEHPQSRTVFVGSNVVLSVTANGTGPLGYQWLRNGTNISAATEESYTLNNVDLSQAGNYSVRVTNGGGTTVSSNAALVVVKHASGNLFNINFGQDGGAVKTGVAAVGQATSDYWNFYSRDGAVGWQTFGVLPNLKLADGTTTMAGLTVANAPGSWGTSSSDPMYLNYLYPFSGVATITVTNLNAGQYDVYVYAYDGNYELTVGAANYGIRTCRDNSPVGIPIWQEGQQYVRFNGVSVAAGQAMTLTVQSGLDGYAIISGMQLVYVAALPPPPPDAPFLANVDFSAGSGPSAKVGLAAIGQTTDDFWNFYTRDDGAGGWRSFGVLSNLTLANGTTTSVGLTVANAPGAWGTTSADPMYVNYIYPFSGDATITVTNLPAGQYDLYLYGPDSRYVVHSGGVSYGIRTNVDSAATGTPVWQEGVQFARYRDLIVSNNTQTVTITVQSGVNGYATISGLQLAQTAVVGATNHCGRLNLHCNKGGCVRLRFVGAPSHRYWVQASTDLIHWTDLGCVISDDSGNCDFEDRDSIKFPRRYYRIVLP